MGIPNIVRNALYSKLSKRTLRAQKLILSYLIKKAQMYIVLNLISYRGCISIIY